MKIVTLANLSECTAQEVFDYIANHLLTQNRKAQIKLPEGIKCAYRTPQGLTCAAGCLIPEKDYDKNFETVSWGMLVDDHMVPESHEFLISELQSIHDDARVEYWENRLIELAKRKGLSYNKELYGIKKQD